MQNREGTPNELISPTPSMDDNTHTGTLTTNDPISEYEKSRNEQIKENQRYLSKFVAKKNDLEMDSAKEEEGDKNITLLLWVSQSPCVISDVENHENPQEHARSRNNCGVHTFLRIITAGREEINRLFSTEFIKSTA